jgi:hypothetical protein
VRALYELAIAQPLLDMPELLWKGYIDFEISQVCFGLGLQAFWSWVTPGVVRWGL